METKKPTIVVTSHIPQRWNKGHTKARCWCGWRYDENAAAPVPQSNDEQDVVAVVCALCEAAQIVDRVKIADVFNSIETDHRQ